MEPAGRILIADDEDVFLASTADLLRDEGHVVDAVPDAPSALEHLSRERYDVLISDIRMPGNGELGLLQSIPELNAGIPAILVTGYPSAPTAIQALERSALAYLVKPFEFEALLAQVEKGLALRRVQDALGASARRARAWSEETARYVEALRDAPGGLEPLSLKQLHRTMLGHLGGTLLDLQKLMELETHGQVDAACCTVQQCPRLEAYEVLIKEGIQTLERTKGAFKSRELGELRQKLEGAVSVKD